MRRPEEYRHIHAWGIHMQSDPSYIREQQQKASESDAPLDAIYQDMNGRWACFHDVEREDTRKNVLQILHQQGGGH